MDIEIEKGQFVAILGHNGSGKSTLAKHMNAILEPSGGEMWVDGMDTSDEKHLWDIRQSAGMVFQNPDNQIIASVVEEDVGFGPENIGVPTDEIWGACRGEFKGSRNVEIPQSFSEQAVGRTETACGDCGSHGNAAGMYYL